MKKLSSGTKLSFLVSLLIVFVLAGLLPASVYAQAQEPIAHVSTSNYLSPIKDAPIQFTGVGLSWHQVKPTGTSARLFFRFNTLAAGWGEWQEVIGDLDNKFGATEGSVSTFVSTEKSSQLQYKVMLESDDSRLSPQIDNLEITYLNAQDNPSVIRQESLVASITTPVNISSPIKIISRTEWGADESLRYYTEDRPAPKLVAADPDFLKTYSAELKIAKTVPTEDGKDLTWPLQYPEKVSKFIIHHTATTKDLDNPAQAIRNIYYWHAITKGWGDIGYNYIIDPKGNIYQGRYGDDGVVGGHAGTANVGSIGIAVLGNYQDNEVPEAVVNSLAALIKMKAEKLNIDPAGKSNFRGEYSDNVMGHRDVMSTTCPGDKLYNYLPVIRNIAKYGFKTSVVDNRRIASQKDYDYSLASNIPTVEMDPGSRKRMIITLKNTGIKTWGADTYLVVGDTESSRQLLNLGSMVKSAQAGKQVLPGGSVSFDLNIQAGYLGGIGSMELYPVIGDKSRIEKYISIPLRVKSPDYDYQFVSLNVTKDKLKPGETTEAKLVLKNTSSISWKRDGKNRLMIGTENPRDHIARILGKADTRLAYMVEREVAPNANATFIIKIVAPSNPGIYREYFAPVVEGITWLPFKQNYVEINVYDDSVSAKYTGTLHSFSMLPSERKVLDFVFQNAGNSRWSRNSTSPLNFEIKSDSGLRASVPILAKDSVLPGQSIKISITLASPAREGSYKFSIMPRSGTGKLMASPEQFVLRVSKNPVSETSTVSTIDTASSTVVKQIKVAISFQGNPVISADGAFSVYDGAGKLADFLKDEKVSVIYDQQKFQIKGSKQAFVTSNPPRFQAASGAYLRIDNYENRPAWDTTYNDNEYKGQLYVYYYQGALQVVNELPMEDYLKGLAEISAKDPYEKIKAVIVLARSYATYYTTIAQKFPGAPYDLTDDPARSQKYLGHAFEERNLTGVKAVNDTTGQVVTYNGKIIKTPYFSSDDGRTRSAQEVWGWTDTPYLQSVDDPGCKGMTLNGHGVGLSGCGSKYLAGQGKTYIEIIKYYFKGVEVKKI